MSGRPNNAAYIMFVVLASCISRQANGVESGRADLQPAQPLRGAETAESAAILMVRAYADKDYELFMKTRALFECEDESRGGPNRYADSLHFTRFTNRKHSHTVYDVPARLNSGSARTIAKQRPKLEFVDAAMFSDTVPNKQHMFVDVAIEDHNEVSYRTRIVVIEYSNRWYAIPRCYPSRDIYALADAVTSTAPATRAK